MDLKDFLCLVVIMIVMILPGASQNLIPNPGFEIYTSCPSDINMGQPLECPPWIVPTGGTSDYFHTCDAGGPVGIPTNIFGTTPAFAGNAYAGGLFYYSSWVDYREFLQVQLTSPMIAGKPYLVEFYYALSTGSCPIDKLGVYISDTQITAPGFYGPLSVTPQLEVNQGLITGNEWKLFSQCYIANGGEEWITIGNFYPDNQCSLGTGCPTMLGSVISYFYFDEVSVTAGPVLDIDLGPDQTLCAGETIQYNFDPGSGDFLWQDNSTSSNYEIDAPGTYSVTLTNNCAQGSDEVDISILAPPPPFSLGADTTICDFDQIQFSFDPNLGEFEWQDGSTDETYVIDQPGTYALTISNDCGEASDAITVYNYPEPIIDLNLDTLQLCAGDVYHVSLDPTLGDYTWQDGLVSPDYYVDEAGTYTVELTNPCGSDYVEFVVSIIEPPQVNLGNDITICSQQLPYIIDLSGIPNVDEFAWSTGETSSLYSVTGSGTYAVTVSNQCFMEADTIHLAVTDSTISVTLPPDTILCPGGTLQIDLSNLQGTYVWQDNATTSNYAITQSGLYSVTVSNICGTGSDSIQVSFDDQLPALDLGPDFSLCPGEQTTLFADLAGVNFLWNNGSTADSLVVNQAGMYILSISNPCGTVADTVMVIIDVSAPDADLPDQLSICAGDSVMISTSVAGVSYLWNTGQTVSSIIVHDAGLYVLTITNACGSDIDTTTVIDLGSPPVFSLGPDQVICNGDTAFYSISIPGIYNWQDGSTTNTYEATQAGLVILNVSNQCGSATDSSQVTVVNTPTLDLGPDLTLCDGESVTIDPGMMNVNYVWQNGSTASAFTVVNAGKIKLVVSNACGNASDSLQVTTLNSPILDLGPDIHVCAGHSILLHPSLPGVNFLWNTGSTADSIWVYQSATIGLQVTNACGMDKDSIDITIIGYPPAVDLGQDTTLCEGEFLFISVAANGNNIHWENGNTDSTRIISTTGIYAVTLSNDCGTKRDSIEILFQPAPVVFDFGPDQVICEGDSILLSPGQFQPGDDYDWNTGSTDSILLVKNSGIYHLLITNPCGQSEDEVSIGLDSNKIIPVLHEDGTICEGGTAIFTMEQNFPAQYLWTTGETTPAILVHSPGFYGVTVTSACDELDYGYNLEPALDCDSTAVFIPNIFSPNDDQVNDVFSIFWENDAFETFEINIYDRWGNNVFHSKDPFFEWDGSYKGKILQPGVYAYQVVFQHTMIVQEKQTLSGGVTIVR